jgi:hypothetical protein
MDGLSDPTQKRLEDFSDVKQHDTTNLWSQSCFIHAKILDPSSLYCSSWDPMMARVCWQQDKLISYTDCFHWITGNSLRMFMRFSGTG